MKLYGRMYQTKDTNLKFLRSLPKEWKPMTVALRHSHDYHEYNLEKLYGVLKTYELELEQDEEMEKGQRKDKSVALVAQKQEDTVKVVPAKATPSKDTCKGRSEASKGKGKMTEDDDSST